MLPFLCFGKGALCSGKNPSTFALDDLFGFKTFQGHSPRGYLVVLGPRPRAFSYNVSLEMFPRDTQMSVPFKG